MNPIPSGFGLRVPQGLRVQGPRFPLGRRNFLQAFGAIMPLALQLHSCVENGSKNAEAWGKSRVRDWVDGSEDYSTVLLLITIQTPIDRH